ncbi:SDR family NAD(P)-dependent oxidoreductase [Microbispora sp. KK1-11]|uniref:SDR family NAD(P)-dependent oxidoreductase n=1 Tax=Microbispora sp. KK1-11 TaxID=2053005 RepID=UPI001158F8EB|nr:SDR family NAD(P)-dependent oxidoreductase [Microbispora sp. KK1-11]TQS22269.1 SDR family NAD(P)-dependent oxidoreductase [Microbispora sp. KK1-11]
MTRHEVIARHGRIDILVNNAGRSRVGAVEEDGEAEQRALFEVHFFGPAALTRAALPHPRARRSGAIVHFSGMGGRFSGLRLGGCLACGLVSLASHRGDPGYQVPADQMEAPHRCPVPAAGSGPAPVRPAQSHGHRRSGSQDVDGHYPHGPAMSGVSPPAADSSRRSLADTGKTELDHTHYSLTLDEHFLDQNIGTRLGVVPHPLPDALASL